MQSPTGATYLPATSLWVGICLALESVLTGLPEEKFPQPDSLATHVIFLQTDSFTLSWEHSREKQRWEEDYSVVSQDTMATGLALKPGTSRVKGSGAGMEPGPDSRLVDGWYAYESAMRPFSSLRLTRSLFTEDYTLCIHSRCQPLSALLPSDGQVTRLWACKKTR